MLRFLIYAMQFGWRALRGTPNPHPFHGNNTESEKRAFERSRKRRTAWHGGGAH